MVQLTRRRPGKGRFPGPGVLMSALESEAVLLS